MIITRKEHMGKLGEIAMQSRKWPEFFRGSRIVGADSPPQLGKCRAPIQNQTSVCSEVPKAMS